MLELVLIEVLRVQQFALAASGGLGGRFYRVEEPEVEEGEEQGAYGEFEPDGGVGG